MRWLGAAGVLLSLASATAKAESLLLSTAELPLLPAASELAADHLETLALNINGQAYGEAVLLRRAAGGWHASAEDLRAWGVQVPAEAYVFQERRYHPLVQLPGYEAALDSQTLTLNLKLAPDAFSGARLEGRKAPQFSVAPITPGAFLNYDAVVTQVWDDAHADPQAQMFGEAVLFSAYGSLQSSFAGRNLGRSRASAGPHPWARLETFWRQDDVARMATLTLGDATGASGAWGRPLRFGGVRYASNFETNPGFITRPQLAFSGAAAVPSVVEVFVNGSRVESFRVPAGPFEISELPSFNNAGEASLVVTDVLGRQTVLSQTFLNSAEQLRPGLASYSWELGAQRTSLGRNGDEYGDAAAVGQYRYGLSEQLTGEARAEWSPDLRAGGFGLTWSALPVGLISLAVAGSDSLAGQGALYRLALERPSFGGPSLSAAYQYTDRDFRQLGASLAAAQQRSQFALSAGQRFGRFNLGLGFVEQQDYVQGGTRTGSLSASTNLYDWSLSLNANAQHGVRRSNGAALVLSHSFGAGVSGNAQLRQRDSGNSVGWQALTQAQRSLREGPSTGWRAQAGRTRIVPDDRSQTVDEFDRAEAGASLRTDTLTVSGEIAQSRNTTGLRLSAQGAVGLLGAMPFISRSITQSFGWVDEPELAGQPVYVNGQKAVVLDGAGQAVLPRLAPYGLNQVRINLEEAPFDLQVAQPQVQLTAGNRTGHQVSFGARRLRSATFRLFDQDSRPWPAGAVLRIEGGTELFTIAEEGLAYLSANREQVRVQVQAGARACSLDLNLPASSDRLIHLGAFICTAH